MEKRSSFTGSFGFVMAAASSAIGLGNIWRFPYLAAKYGGSAFVLVYILLVVSFGFTLMIAENVIGRKTGKGPLCAFFELCKNHKINKGWGVIGILATIIPAIIFPYYNVIGGWVINYAITYITGAYPAAGEAGQFFSDMLLNPQLLLTIMIAFTVFVTIVVICGVDKGIERVSKILMPLLFILAIAVAIYSVTLPGAMGGVKYLFVPDLGRLTIEGVLGAMGQMFYSLSLAMGIMIAYGSYLPKDSDIEKSVTQIEVFDTLIAILAGLMIIPAVFAFSGGDESALNAGPGLMFVTLPEVFAKMGGTRIIGILFFCLIFFAALTSSISIMEAIVASLCDKFKMNRVVATIATGVWGIVVGTACILGYSSWSHIRFFGNLDILDSMDFITNSVLMPITALLICVFVGYVWGTDKVKAEIELSGKFKREKLFNIMIKYVAPIFVIGILVSSVLNTFGIISM